MKTFFSALETRINAVDSLLCVGLDPHRQDLEEYNRQTVRDYCLRIIEKTMDLAAAFKPNAAFFEALGAEGLIILEDIIRQIPEEIPVILDIKRGDIASTARAYAQAAYEVLKADAVTLNPYLGRDGIHPFIEDHTKGAFILCKTSNPSAGEMQDLLVSKSMDLEQKPRPLYERTADLVRQWNVENNLGLVVGATQIDSLARIRQNDPDVWILAPGIGAQGGNLQEALEVGLRDDGLGMLIPVSRSIARSQDPRQEALNIRAAINQGRSSLPKAKGVSEPKGMSSVHETIAAGLLDIGCIQFGQFTLKSGKTSPIYIDLRRLIAHPKLLTQVAHAYLTLLERMDFDHLGALPYAALPITSAISMLGGWSMVYSRKEEKSYGTKAQVEGIYAAGDTVVVIDDLITTGGSKLEGIDKFREHGLIVKDIVVLIDRSANAGQALKEQGYQLHAFFEISELLAYYRDANLVDHEILEEVSLFLRED